MKNWIRILILCGVCIFTTLTFVACDFSINAAGEDTENPNSNITVPEPEIPTNPIVPSDPLPEEPSDPEINIPEPEDPTPCQHTTYSDWKIITPATCTTAGQQQRICLDCDKIEEQIIQANGHKHIENIIDATCGTAGSKTVTCENCDYNEVVTIPATGKHQMQRQVTIPATCLDGVITHSCSDCGHSETETIPANGNHGYESSITQTATCGADGVKTYCCRYCAHEYTEAIPATGKHDFDHDNPTTIINPSCSTAGQQKITCKICQHYYTEEIAKLDHDYVNHQCVHCGEYQNPMENLVGSTWSITNGSSYKAKWSITFDDKSSYTTFYIDKNGERQPRKYDGTYEVIPTPDKNTGIITYIINLYLNLNEFQEGSFTELNLTYSFEDGQHTLNGLTGSISSPTDSTFIFMGYGV